MTTARPNIILLVIDALRADAVEPFGAPAGSSPTLAALAGRGQAISGVRATASWTLPSHTALFTGELARGLGLGQAPGRTPQSAAPVVRAQQDRLLAEVLRRSGYTTRGVTTNVWAGKGAGFDAGFDEFVELDSSRYSELGGGLRQRIRWDWEGMWNRADDGASQAEETISRWMEQERQGPFFLFVNLVECHSPYLPPRPFDRASFLTRLLAADEAYRYLTFDAIMRTCLGVQRIPASALARMRRLYAASLLYVDAWVQRLLEQLASAGVLEDTLLLVCSDHGENFGEAGLICHGISLDERLLRVPFIAAGPGHQRFSGMRSLAELPARVAAAASLPDHPWGPGLVNGLSVAQWDPLELTEDELTEIVARLDLNESQIDRLCAPLTAAVCEEFKLVWSRDDDAFLYDLKRDPCELSPIRDDAEMRERAGEAWQQLQAAVHHPTVQMKPIPAAGPDELSNDEAADIERKMRLLGYM